MNWQYFQPKFEYRDALKFYKSAWSGHFFFAYDLIRNFKPKVIAELGTDYGHSLFAMSQAVIDEKLDTELHAVDCWEGDKHARFYDIDVYESVKDVKTKYFKDLKITLHKKYFAEAVNDFDDKSIDLLHIDGLHTYEAVKEDFETWLPKVKETGIILFHDIAQKKKDFGVYKLWEELKEKYTTAEFDHSNGLGVLFLDKQLGEELSKLNEYWKVHYQKEWFADRVMKKDKDIEDLQSKIEWQKNHMKELNKHIDDYKEIAKNNQEQAEEIKKEIKFFPVNAILKLKRTFKKKARS